MRGVLSVLAALLILGLVVLLVAGLPLSHLWLDAQWFGSVGQLQVFTLRLTTTLLFGLGAAVIAFGWIAAIWIAGFARVRLPWSSRSVNVVLALVALLIAIVFGLAASELAPDYLTWSHQVPFQLADPVFGQDIAYYVFTLPLLASLQGWVLWLLIVTLAGLVVPLAIAGQWVDVSARFQRQLVPGELENLYTFPRKVSALPRSPLVRLTCIVGALFMLVLAWGRWLDIWELVYSERGAVFGASRTDLSAELLVIYLLIGLAVIGCAGLVVVAVVRPSPWPVLLVPGAYLALSVALLGIWPALYEGIYVRPNQLGQEQPFITNNIAMTRYAFKLNGIDEQALQGNGALTAEDLQNNAATLSDLRITDQQALLAAYQQTQRLRQYYDFQTVSVDRYPLAAGTAQVMLAPREMDVTNLPAVARTWQNDHLVYTHGQGVAASRVNAVQQGLPRLLVRDLPPQTDEPALAVTQPQIYYGQQTPLYAVVGTSIQEFDRPGGPGKRSEIYANYQGSEGISVGNPLQRAALALAVGDGNLLLSNAVLSDSRILLHRLITDRVETLAPFLRLDGDPYMVVLDGQLIWVIDAYTWSDRFPDATRQGSLNYVRNSVKVTVNAYDGTVHFYVVDPQDPIVQTYQRIYPSLFQPVSDAPPELPPHFRSPDDLLTLQAQAYATYHMTDPRTFYNREDLWNIASEVSGGRAQQMSPYYVRMQLPGQTSVEFTSILPFTPSGQDRTNMVAWMAARSDPPHYGELSVYRFPANSFVYGPQQIGARINQEPTISSQLTLWGQQGSSAIMGNLLVIPLQDSPLYVEPLYIRAQNNPLPQLQRVIVASTQAVVMSDTLPTALQALAAGKHGEVLSTPGAEAAPSAPAPTAGGTLQDLARQALQTYQDAVQAQRQGDWATYGQQLQQLENILDQMNQGGQ